VAGRTGIEWFDVAGKPIYQLWADSLGQFQGQIA
jgi:hypothetical protein